MPVVSDLSVTAVATIAIAFALAGLVKGATGAGAPLIAIPVMAVFIDIRLAVIIMVLPSVLTNLWQIWRYRSSRLEQGATLRLALAGGVGAVAGTGLLATLPPRTLTLFLTAVLVGYLALRVARPEFRLPLSAARSWAVPVGLAGGLLQGAGGISAPVTVSFLSALRLGREEFIVTISSLFAVMSGVQFVSLTAAGLLTLPLATMSLAALLPLVAAMPVGAMITRTMSRDAFDKVVLGLLWLLTLRLVWSLLA